MGFFAISRAHPVPWAIRGPADQPPARQRVTVNAQRFSQSILAHDLAFSAPITGVPGDLVDARAANTGPDDIAQMTLGVAGCFNPFRWRPFAQQDEQGGGGRNSLLAPRFRVGEDGDGYIRVGRWMSPEELNKMKQTNLVQEPPDGTGVYILRDGPDSFRKQAKQGSVYVEFDIPKNTNISITNEQLG